MVWDKHKPFFCSSGKNYSSSCKVFLWLFLGIFLYSNPILSQDSTAVVQDNLGNVENRFQEYFFEALKQKAIENPKKAITALEKAIELQPEEAILYVEMGKNQHALKNYSEAEENFQIALKKNPTGERYILAQLFEVLYDAHQYDKAIPVVKKLTAYDGRYYEDLANLYMMIKQPDMALEALENADKLMGSSSYRDELRTRIFHITGNDNAQISYLKKQISANPENQENYLELIKVYHKNGQTPKAFSLVEDFQKSFPHSNKIHLALYPLYFSQNQHEKAIASIRKILSDRALDEKEKVLALNTFIAFTRENPKYENELAEVVNEAIKTETNTKSNKELGDYYSDKEPEKALGFYVKALEENFSDVRLIEKILHLQLELKKYEDVLILGQKALTVFPSRPALYLALGKANNQKGNSSTALENLEMGLIYLIENPEMEADFYEQMSKAHEKTGNSEKAAFLKKKAENLKNKNE